MLKRRADIEEQLAASGCGVKPIPAMRLGTVTDTIDPPLLSQRIEPMFERVKAELTAANASLATAVATYIEVDAGMAVVVGCAHEAIPPSSLESIELPTATLDNGAFRSWGGPPFVAE